MQRLYGTHDQSFLQYLQQVLQQEKIECIIKNHYLSGAVGELPPAECVPELWLLDNTQKQRAENVLNDLLSATDSHADWQCPQCKAENPGHFASCWQCGSDRS